jgi:transcriptional regulator with AAA-type ATPase domain
MIQRVRGRGEIVVDNRIVSATHRDIDEAIEEHARLVRRALIFAVTSGGGGAAAVPILPNNRCG